MASIAEKFPNIASEWDYEKNGNLTPDKVPVGSHKDAYWICPTCGQSYKSRICNRTAPSRQKKTSLCPICLGRTIIPGFNSLKAKFPNLVDKEWDYDLNNVDPDTIAPHTNKSFFWKCLNGHESYKSKVNNKVNGNGGNCPKCSHQKLSSEFSLATIKPELVTEWDVEANGGMTPDMVSAYANKAVWWKCQRCGHKWKADIDNRSNGKGCPECAKGHHTSFPEQAVYYFVHLLCTDAINGYRLDGKEIDVFIPSLKVGIEYDGEAFHGTNERLKRDIQKSEYLSSKGIKLFRIRETGCPLFSSDSATVLDVKYSSDYSDLEQVIQTLIDNLCITFSLVSSVKVDIPAVRNCISAKVKTVAYEDSFAAWLDKRESCGEKPRAFWDYEANAPLRPDDVYPHSEKQVKWICPVNPEHHWINTVKSVTLGYGCSKCSGKYHYSTDDWIQKARVVHGDKYDYSNAVYVNSKTPLKIICKEHGEFQQIPSEHMSGKGCRFCAHQAFHPLESLAIISPEIAQQWDYEKNSESGFTPETIGIDTTRQFWWHCTNGKPHSFHATIAKRVNGGMQCAVCHGKQISYDTSLECLFPKLAMEWCPENEKRACEVSPGSEYRAQWKCPNPNHPPYQAIVGNRTRLKSGCPLCARERKSKNNGGIK